LKPAIVFIGFMGAGKSWSVASVESLAGAAFDIDELIERRVGMSVREFFDSRDEAEFRRVEEEVASDLLANADGGAIALGGGTVLSPKVCSQLDRHTVVWLDVDAETAWGRVSKSDRPLVARGRERFDALLDERRPIYERLADVVLSTGDPDLVLRALPSIQALADFPSGTKLLWAASASGEYPIFVGPGLLGKIPWPLPGRRFCITDTAVEALYAADIEQSGDQPVRRVPIGPGEESKTMSRAEDVLERLARAGMTREDHVVALGGGVVGDLAGFCAHIYQRGVPVVHVPTTLVAQVDSAYGGKTGVNLSAGKNYAGAYQLPAAVIADTSTLATLPHEELAAGFVEVLKTGLLAGGELWERTRSIETLDPVGLDDVVFACARYKCEVVAADERDSGLRQVLNLGHTVGHAIEAVSRYEQYRHGEAVGLGLLAALRLSGADSLRDEVEEMLRRHGLPVTLGKSPAWGATDVVAALQRDKKRTAAGVGFVLLPEPGDPHTGELVDPAKVEAAVEELLT